MTWQSQQRKSFNRIIDTIYNETNSAFKEQRLQQASHMWMNEGLNLTIADHHEELELTGLILLSKINWSWTVLFHVYQYTSSGDKNNVKFAKKVHE